MCGSYPDKVYDWKITMLFYCAYHLLKALAAHRGVDIGDRHSTIIKRVKPNSSDHVMQIKKDAYYAYDQLFEYSRTARYEGFIDFDEFQLLKKADYEDAIRRFDYFKKYIASQGVVLDAPTLQTGPALTNN